MPEIQSGQIWQSVNGCKWVMMRPSEVKNFIPNHISRFCSSDWVGFLLSDFEDKDPDPKWDKWNNDGSIAGTNPHPFKRVYILEKFIEYHKDFLLPQGKAMNKYEVVIAILLSLGVSVDAQKINELIGIVECLQNE